MNFFAHPLVLFIAFVVVMVVARLVINRRIAGKEKSDEKKAISMAEIVAKLNRPAPERELKPVSKVRRRGSVRSTNPAPNLAGPNFSKFGKNKKRGLSKPRFATA